MSTRRASPALNQSRQAEHGTGELLGTGLREMCEAQADSAGSPANHRVSNASKRGVGKHSDLKAAQRTAEFPLTVRDDGGN